MSAPDPEKWQITKTDWEEMVDTWGYWNEPLPKVVADIARRRALEELRALVPVFCEYCRRGLPSRRVNPERFGSIQHDLSGGNWSPHTWCEAAHLRERIAAIEAEEA